MRATDASPLPKPDGTPIAVTTKGPPARPPTPEQAQSAERLAEYTGLAVYCRTAVSAYAGGASRRGAAADALLHRSRPFTCHAMCADVPHSAAPLAAVDYARLCCAPYGHKLRCRWRDRLVRRHRQPRGAVGDDACDPRIPLLEGRGAQRERIDVTTHVEAETVSVHLLAGLDLDSRRRREMYEACEGMTALTTATHPPLHTPLRGYRWLWVFAHLAAWRLSGRESCRGMRRACRLRP